MHVFGTPRHTQSMIAYNDFEGIFLEKAVKDCIVGMLTCSIGSCLLINTPPCIFLFHLNYLAHGKIPLYISFSCLDRR